LLLTYEEVKKFIEIDSQSGCELLSKEYINNRQLLEIKCKCGEPFEVSYNTFKDTGKRQCNKCSGIINWSYKLVKQFVELDSNSGCKLISEEYADQNHKLNFECKCGKPFSVSFAVFNYHKQRHCDECSRKTKWTIDKIREYIENSEYILISTEYIKAKSPLTIKDKEGYYYSQSIDSLRKNMRRNSILNKFDKGNPYTIQNIRLWCVLNNKTFILISELWEGDRNKLKWKCLIDTCEEIFEAPWIQIQQGCGCQFCVHKQVGLSNCLARINPELAKEWHPTKNGSLTPFDVTYNSNKKVWWQCKKEKEHVWMTTINSRSKGSGCPDCSKLRVTDKYNLLVCNPYLAIDWDYNKNKDRPEDYAPFSPKSVYWQCSKNPKHKWKTCISNRSKRGDGCPYCSGRRVSEDHNLLIYNPELCKEWNYDKNEKGPNEYTKNSNIKVWWKCKECDHEWQSTIANRNNLKRGCPKCNESHGEKRVRIKLELDNLPYDVQHTFDDLRGIGGGLLKFDAVVFWDIEKTKLRLLIEYDGIFHYEKQYDDDGYETLQIHDKLKDVHCTKNNIILIRIPYWEYDNIEEILDSKIHMNKMIN